MREMREMWTLQTLSALSGDISGAGKSCPNLGGDVQDAERLLPMWGCFSAFLNNILEIENRNKLYLLRSPEKIRNYTKYSIFPNLVANVTESNNNNNNNKNKL
jgi:hypothetical protein